MIVKRDTIKPIKSYYIKKRTDYDEKDLNIHLFTEKLNGKSLFTFILSLDEKEEFNIVNRENILSTIHFENKDDAKLIISSIGKAIKKTQTYERELYDLDIIESLKNEMSNINHFFWNKKNLTKFMSKEEKIKYEENKNLTNNDITEEDSILYATKPLIMIETLDKLGIIQILRLEPNGDETKYKFKLNNGVSTEFNISVVKREGLNGNKSNIFKDFYNSHTKGLGNGGLGILTHLGEYGLFGQSHKNESPESKVKRAKEFFKEQIQSKIKEEDLIYTSESTSYSRVFLEKNIDFQPIKKENEKTDLLMKDFLKFRGISEETINKLYKDDVIINGDVHLTRILEELKDDNISIKENYHYNNYPLVRLRKADNSFLGAERFEIKRDYKNTEKPFIYDKKNTGSLEGKFFAFGELEKPTLAIIHEAVIDSLSSYELLKEANLDADSVKYISTQGASHTKKFCSINLGFTTETKDNMTDSERKNRTKAVYNNIISKDLNEDILDEYKNLLKNKNIVFFDYGDTSTLVSIQLEKLKIIFEDRIKIIKKEKRSDISFNDYDKVNDFLIDQLNFNDFLDKLKLSYEFDKELKESVFKTCYSKDNEVILDTRKKKTIRNKIIKFFGTENVAFCLDNDHAGLPYVILFSEMKRHFDINVSYMIPDDLKYDNYKGLSLKSMMKEFNELTEKGSYEEAYDLLGVYIKQKPKVDNNDILKHYQKIKLENNVEAKSFLESKISTLNISKDSQLYTKKKLKETIKYNNRV